MKKLENIKLMPIKKLFPASWNPRILKNKRFDALCQSLRNDPDFMGLKPILATKSGMVFAGNMRLRAAEHLGWKKIPAIIVDIPEKLAKERAIKDNSNFGEWNTDELATILDELEKQNIEIEQLGLEKQIEDIIKRINQPEISEDDVPPVPKETKIKMGDLFQLGEHRLLCGDATRKEDMKRLMNDEKADCVFTDPPYGVSISKKNKFLNAHSEGRRTEDSVIDDDLNPEELKKRLLPAFVNIRENMNDCCSVFVTAPQGGELGMMMMMREASLPVRHILIWKKHRASFSMGRLDYEYQHEAILLTWGKKHKFYGMGSHKTSVWEIDRPTASKQHPTMKPVELVANALLNNSQEGDIVLDAYGGSGTTLIASEQLNRKCRMMEIDEKYCQVIIDRWENLTGKKAKQIK